MAWLARKSMNLGGVEVAKGDLVPQRVIDKVPAGRFGSLVRVGYLQEATPSQVRASKPRPAPEPEPVTDPEPITEIESEDD